MLEEKFCFDVSKDQEKKCMLQLNYDLGYQEKGM
jgi:hypothetical protein